MNERGAAARVKEGKRAMKISHVILRKLDGNTLTHRVNDAQHPGLSLPRCLQLDLGIFNCAASCQRGLAIARCRWDCG